MKVLLIEDDDSIVETVTLALQMRWPEAQLIHTPLGEKGIELVKTASPDVVILDLGLPDTSGFDVLKRIRLFSSLPIVILTVRADESDIVKGLEWGADDYMTKPFRQLELLARLKSLTRRQSLPIETATLVYGPLRFDPSNRELFCGDRRVDITSTEGQILHRLMINPGHVVTSSGLAEAVWGENRPGAANNLRVHIRRLRQKVEADPNRPRLVRTKPGVGYFLAKPSRP